MSGFEIIRLTDLTSAQRAEIIPALDALFFAASNTQDFTSADEKAAFRETWLGRYITHYPNEFFLALSDRGELLGYLAGCLDNPAQTPLFSNIEYFKLFVEPSEKYPAQLHINTAPNARGTGIGRALIDTYTTQCVKSGVAGCHVVTRVGAENIGFYRACGFVEVARERWDERDRTLVFLGKQLV